MLLKFVSAFVFVIALLYLFSWVMKRSGVANAIGSGNLKRRLNIVEFMSLDHRRKLVLVRCDDKEHLLLLGSQSELVVESGMPVKTVESGNADVEE